MKDYGFSLLDEAIETERNMWELYDLFRGMFKEDSDFWEQMVREEKHHELILKTGLLYLAFDVLPDEVLYDSIEELRNTNKSIRDTIAQYKRKTPAKNKAYRYAVKMENSAAEAHFQKLMHKERPAEVLKVWQRLNDADIDHANRINKLL